MSKGGGFVLLVLANLAAMEIHFGYYGWATFWCLAVFVAGVDEIVRAIKET